MFLLIYRVWHGPSRQARLHSKTPMEVNEREESYVTKLGLSEAIRQIRDYDVKFAKVYGEHSVVEHTLKDVRIIPDISRNDAELARIFFIEDLAKGLDEELETRHGK